MRYTFSSSFAEYIKALIESKRAYGYDYSESERLLHYFDEFCLVKYPNADTITQEIFLKWAERRETENNKYRLNRISVVRELSRYMRSIGIDSYVLPNDLVRKDSRHVPHIYSMEELTRIFSELDKCKYNRRSPARHLVIPVIFRLIYCCGLRPVEARRLKCEDVDLRTGSVKILESKGHKDRMVVMAPDLLELCIVYDRKVLQIYPKRVYFFPSPVNDGKSMYSMEWIIPTFRKAVKAAGVYDCPGSTPRLYDLRHTFATHVIHQWINEGRNIDACLPYLSEYMGHENISDTAYYIHFSPEFYSETRDWDNGITSRIIREV